MHAIQGQVALAREHGLFKAASASQVLWHLLLVVTGNSELGVSQHDSLPVVTKVDFFISHSWSCPSWIKFLALCHQLNFDLAIASSLFACLFATAFLVSWCGSVTGVAQHPRLLQALVIPWPTAVFFTTYFLGHLLKSGASFWIDQVCIHQRNLLKKTQTLQALPGIIAQSSQMLVVWDEIYFQRLWCNYELAVHTKTSKAGSIQIVPTWMPLWTLASFGVLSTAGYLYAGSSAAKMDTDSGLSLFSSLWNAYILPYVLELFAASIPLTCCCLHKLKRHKLMLDQMMHFDLKSAKCTLETDRIVLQQQVLNLFDEALQPPLSVEFSRESTPILSTDDTEEPLISPEDIRSIRPITSYPSKDEVIGEFNEYVRRTLRDSILDSMGKEEFTSLKFCIAVCLPAVYMGLNTVLNCDGFGDCSVSAAKRLGYTSVSKYMISNAVISTFLLPLSMILSFPLMLRTNSLVYNMVSGTISQVALGSFVTALVLIVTQSYASIQTVGLIMAVEKESLCWFAAFLCLVALEFWAMYVLFRTKAHGGTTSSCRTVG